MVLLIPRFQLNAFPLGLPERGLGHILRERSSHVLVKQCKLSEFWHYSASLSTRDGVYLTYSYVFYLFPCFLGVACFWRLFPYCLSSHSLIPLLLLG